MNGQAATSDKAAGVVGLAFFDLRAHGKVGQRIGLCGTDGTKFPGIRAHMRARIQDVYGLDTSCETFPSDDKKDRKCFVAALETFERGDLAVVSTPDDTHFEIALAALRRGLHVLVRVPIHTLTRDSTG